MPFVIALLLSLNQQPAEIRANPHASFEEIVSLPLVYTAPGANRVVVKRGLSYKTTAAGPLRLDVYLPPDSGADHGVALIIHGGVGPDESPRDWGIYRSWGRTIAASGLVAVVPNQRLGFPARHYDEGASDIRDAMDFVRNHRRNFHAADRFCLMAFSGGGPLLAQFLRSARSDVKCLAGFYPILDTADTANPESQVTDQQRREYSVVATVSEGAASPLPLLIARAGRDQIPGVRDAIDRFVPVALQRNLNLTLLNHPDGRHGFDYLDDDDRSREIILTAINFLKTHLQQE